jgi:hypothetical protein
MTRAEQETIFTAHPSTARKLERAGYVPHKVSRQGGRPVGWFYNVPLREFRWRVGARKKLVLSEGQRLVLAEKLRKARPHRGVMRSLGASYSSSFFGRPRGFGP